MPRREFRTLSNNLTPVGCWVKEVSKIMHNDAFPFLFLNPTHAPCLCTWPRVTSTRVEPTRASWPLDVLLEGESTVGKEWRVRLPWSTLGGHGRSLKKTWFQRYARPLSPRPVLFFQRFFKRHYGIIQVSDCYNVCWIVLMSALGLHEIFLPPPETLPATVENHCIRIWFTRNLVTSRQTPKDERR